VNDAAKANREISIPVNKVEHRLSFGEGHSQVALGPAGSQRHDNSLPNNNLAQFPTHGELDPRGYNLGPYIAVGKKYRIDVVGLWSNGGGPSEGCRDANGDPKRKINGLPAWCLLAQPHAASDGQPANNIWPIGTWFELGPIAADGEPIYLVFFMNDDDYSDNHKCTQPGMTPMSWTLTQI
jgi:hypothetical protein